MANFEHLIRQALARQNNADPQMREKIYRASRNALQRMYQAEGLPDNVEMQRQKDILEASIRRVEADYRGQPTGHGVEAEFPKRQSGDRGEPYVGVAHRDEDTIDFSYDGEIDDDLFFEDEQYQPAGGGVRRMIAIVAAVLLILVIGWLIFSLVQTLGSDRTATDDSHISADETNVAQETNTGPYITILSPADTSALQTAGRGTAEIINQSNLELIRLTSIRPIGKYNIPAEPMILAVGPGVIDQIAGRRVTVEIMARSGTGSPATFAVNCAMGDEDPCGRKRFRIGLQPEAIVFTMELPEEVYQAANPHFGISTDVTSTASVTGKGDAIDILYARLRVPDAG